MQLPLTGIKRIDHIAIAVRNIEAASAIYRDTLGIVPSAIMDVPTEGVRIALLPLGGPDGTKIELLEPLAPTNSIARFIEKRGEGQHHICFEVVDIDAALATLRAANIPVVDETPRRSAEGRAIFVHPKGTNGVLIELVQLTGV